ncbi:hypothetical protein MN116_000415, partial [Schistosoma mekongi]
QMIYLFYEIKLTLQQSMSVITWLNEQQQYNHHLLNKIKTINLLVRYPVDNESVKKENLSIIYIYLMNEDDYYWNEFQIRRAKYMDTLRSRLFSYDVSLSEKPSFAFYVENKLKENSVHMSVALSELPLYSHKDDTSSQLARIGFILGHELVHAVDTQGVYHDADGNKNTTEFYKTLSKRIYNETKCFTDQFTAYGVTSEKMSHHNILDEIIADNGGLRVAFNTYRRLLMSNVKNISQDINFTLASDQSFFLKFGEIMCGHHRGRMLQKYLSNSPYLLERDRVNGALSNNEEFAAAFSCPVGSPMNPAKKCKVW